MQYYIKEKLHISVKILCSINSYKIKVLLGSCFRENVESRPEGEMKNRFAARAANVLLSTNESTVLDSWTALLTRTAMNYSFSYQLLFSACHINMFC